MNDKEKVLRIPGAPTRESVVNAIIDGTTGLICAHASAIIEHGPQSTEAQLFGNRVRDYLKEVLASFEDGIKRRILGKLSDAVGISVLGMSTPHYESSVMKAAAPPAPKKSKARPKRKAKAATNPSTKPNAAPVEKLETLIPRHLPNDSSVISGSELLKRLRQEPGRATTTTQNLRHPLHKLVAQRIVGHNSKPTNARLWFKTPTNSA